MLIALINGFQTFSFVESKVTEWTFLLPVNWPILASLAVLINVYDANLHLHITVSAVKDTNDMWGV